MKNMKVEFFHDVICSFCFPMSYRMRQLQAMMPDIEIAHRSFALVQSEHDFDRMFGSREAAKNEILEHWEHANANDDLHRFNISGMRQADFPFPSSMNVLEACKAAYFAAGSAGYWDVFDALQKALFVQNRNIEEQDVIEACVKETGIDFEKWKQHVGMSNTKEAVEEDLLLAKRYGIHGVPCLIINGKHRVSGAQPLSQIIHAIQSAFKETEDAAPNGASCHLEGGKMECE